MAIAIVNTTTVFGNRSAVSDNTGFAHDNLTATYLLVGILQGFSDSSAVPTAVTFAGNTMTKIAEFAYASSNAVSVWALKNPPTGSGTVSITHTGNSIEVITALSCTGVDLTTPFGISVNANATSTAPSGTVSSAAGELVIDFVAIRQNNSATATVGAGQTQVINQSAGGTASVTVRGLISTEPGAASVVMSWSLSASEIWKSVSIPFKPAAAAGRATSQTTMVG